jgi:(R,R)-butanediol dehydrogenase/meso-butanediol dehydrogenase/diacetyl reductase
MRAMVVRAGGALAVESVPDPVPGEDQIVLRVDACGVCGTDLHLHAKGLLAPGTVMGHEFAGEVSESAHGFRAGQRVCALPVLSCGRCRRCRSGLGAYCESQRTLGLGAAPGAFAEYVAVAAHETLRLPDAIDPETGALVEPLAVALHAVRVARVRVGDGCLVLGAGPIGLGVLLWARYFGAREVVVCERSPERRRLAEQLGAGATAAPEELDAVLARQLPGGAAVVIEAIGAPGAIERALGSAGFRGRVVVAGVCLEPDTIQPLPSLLREATLHFVLAYEKDDFQFTLDALAAGRIDALPMVTRRCGLAELPAAFGALEAGSAHGKVLYVR